MKKIIQVLLSLFVLLLVISMYQDFDGIKSGYFHETLGKSGEAIYKGIMKDNKFVVLPTVVSVDNASHYIAGLRLPLKYFKCDYKIIDGEKKYVHSMSVIENKKEYFVFDINTKKTNYYNSKDNFLKYLERIGIRQNIVLDYSAFDAVFDYYSPHFNMSDIDLSNCIPVDSIW